MYSPFLNGYLSLAVIMEYTFILFLTVSRKSQDVLMVVCKEMRIVACGITKQFMRIIAFLLLVDHPGHPYHDDFSFHKKRSSSCMS
jgi:hypothetical protein